jgi:type IV pilus assembly protein PilA
MLNKLTKLREKRAQGDNGFTLIELLVVVVIIGILIAIAIPLYLNYQKGAKNKSAQSDVRNAVSTVEQCITDNSGNLPAAPTGNNTVDTALVFTCGTGTQTANVSNGNKVLYTPVGTSPNFTSYTLAGVNKDGNKTYTYDSTAGGKVQ